jgi:hypothetical protein
MHACQPCINLAHELNVELEFGVRWNHAASAPGTIAQIGGDDQQALAADLHGGDALRGVKGGMPECPRASEKTCEGASE